MSISKQGEYIYEDVKNILFLHRIFCKNKQTKILCQKSRANNKINFKTDVTIKYIDLKILIISINTICVMMSYLKRTIFLNNLSKFHGDLINFSEISNDDAFNFLMPPVKYRLDTKAVFNM